MIDKIKFFENKKRCPVCNKKLSLYLSIDSIGTFKSIEGQDKNTWFFKPLKNDTFGLLNQISINDFIQVILIDDIKFSLSFSSEALFRAIEYCRMNFFYLCNEKAIKVGEGYVSTINNYEISNYEMCYFKMTNALGFKNNNTIYSLQMHDEKSPIGLEIMSVYKESDDINKYYCLVYDFNENKTKFYFITGDPNSITKFNNNQFVKEFPILEYYPNFKNKEKIISKFESWVILS